MSERDPRGSTPTRFASIAADMMADLPEPPAPTAEEIAERRAHAHRVNLRFWLEYGLEFANIRAVRFIIENPEVHGIALEAVKNWLESPKAPHLLLRGTTGTGKTVAAAWLVRHCSEPEHRHQRGGLLWMYPDDVVSAVLHRWDDKAPKIPKYVVIDELGTETRPEFMTALSRLLDRDKTHVLMTTNLSRAEFQKRYGKDERLLSRASGNVEIVDVTGKDRRRPVNP